MDPRLRNGLIIVATLVVAAYLSSQVAQGMYGWPSLIAIVTLAAVLVRFTGLSADVLLVGFLLVGYIVGNRGFAQLMPAPGLPLFPAEAGLLVAVSWRIIVCAFERRLPFRTDALNWAVLAWVVIGTVRVVFDVPRHGFLALRDYAMIYYAIFFFLVQHMARDAAARRYLVDSLLVASCLLVPVYILNLLFPDFFLTQLTVNGTPLIFLKGDLAVTFLGVGSLVCFHWARGLHRYWAWPLAGLNFLLVLGGGNRASVLGVAVAAALLVTHRHWRWSLLLGAVGGAALLGLVGLATVFNHVGAQQRLHNLSDQVRSVVDVAGTGTYQSQDSYFKGANNRFRLIWWRNVAEETTQTNPLFGLGFGADLARGFTQEYFPEGGEDFSARSPHSIFMTTYGRMGATGLLVWAGFCVMLLRRAWQVLRHSTDPVAWGLWCSAWVILSSASFGVVLEGPMGAVVFWTVLGLASAWPAEGVSATKHDAQGEVAEVPALADLKS